MPAYMMYTPLALGLVGSPLAAASTGPWRVRPVYLAPPRWTITTRIPPSAQEFHSRLFVDPHGQRRLYNPKYDTGWTFNASDWTPATLERQLGKAGAPP